MPNHGDSSRSDAPPGSTRELSTRLMDTRLPTTRTILRRPRRPPPPLPDRIGRFRPLEVLGQGGMGVVYRAEDPSLDRIVALKLLTPHRADVDAQQRLRREAQALAQLSHPNVVQVFDSGVFRGQVYIAMELVPGRSLRAWVRDQPRTHETIVEAYVQAGLGLSAAHERGIIHRDFKPDNAIMGDDGRVRVLDFGLARADEGTDSRPAPGAVDSDGSTAPFPSMLDLRLTASGAVMGTPVYMAPELHQGHPATPSSDQFALCVSLFEAVYGRRPFEGTRLHELVGHMLRDEVSFEPVDAKASSQAPSQPPPWLRAAILRGLRSDPEQRWPSLDALLAELRRGINPSARRRWAPTVVVALALSGGAVALATASDDSQCADAHGKLAGVWDDARRIEVRLNLLRSPAPYAAATWTRVETQLDDYAEHWIDAHGLACGRERDDGTLDLRMLCLDRRRQGLAAAVDVLADPDQDVLVRAGSLVGELGDVDGCMHGPVDGATALPAPRDAAQAAMVEELREQLAKSAALNGAGRYDDSGRLASETLQAAEALGYAPLVAEAALREGVARFRAGDPDRGAASLERAYFVAAELGYDEIVGEASAWLVHATGVGQGDLEAARRWAEHALAATEGRDGPPRAFVLAGMGMVHYERGEVAEAREWFEQELALLERTLDPLDVRLASSLNRLGMVLADEEHYDQAVAVQERAFSLWERAVGPDHPKLATAHHYRALAYNHRGDYERALHDNRRSLEILERTLGPEHPEVGASLANLGVVLRAMGRNEEALAHYRRALEGWARTLGPDHPRMASMHLNIGHVLDDLGQRSEAIAELRRALEIRERAFGPEHPETTAVRESIQERLADPDDDPPVPEVGPSPGPTP